MGSLCALCRLGHPRVASEGRQRAGASLHPSAGPLSWAALPGRGAELGAQPERRAGGAAAVNPGRALRSRPAGTALPGPPPPTPAGVCVGCGGELE